MSGLLQEHEQQLEQIRYLYTFHNLEKCNPNMPRSAYLTTNI